MTVPGDQISFVELLSVFIPYHIICYFCSAGCFDLHMGGGFGDGVGKLAA
jgi:hypothetical protein